MTSGEILQLDLQAELAVLSACDTAKGRTVESDFVGLPYSLFASGVPSVVMTLWAIPDMPTSELMIDFYKRLRTGETKVRALRQAILATMKNHPDPRDWAAFVLLGNPD